MTLVQVKIPDNNSVLVIELLEKLGCEVKEKKAGREKTSKTIKQVKEKKVPVDYLFGKWADTDYDPKTYRKKIWAREL